MTFNVKHHFNGMFNSQICIYVFPDSEMLTINLIVLSEL